MKKLFAFITALLVLSCVVFADVSVKDLGNGTVEVTFFYGNPKAAEVVVAGDFTNWQAGAVPMTKVEKGWEYKTTVPMATVMKYKFISDGNWTFDLKSPDKVDDGFGAFNGIVDVTKLVATEKAKASGDTAALAKLSAGANIKFTTWTLLSLDSNFRTQEVANPKKKGFDAESVYLHVKSYDKFSGEFLKNMPFYIEIALAEDKLPALWQRSVTGVETIKFKDSLPALFQGLLTNPVSYLNGGTKDGSYLGHLKFGMNTPYVNFLTGYKYAKLPVNKSILWTTVDGDFEAGYDAVGGYNQFSLGQKLQTIGDFKVNAAIAPNKSADRAGNQYGLWSYVNAEKDGIKGEIQYNAAYKTTTETNIYNVLNTVSEQDFIAGAIVPFGKLSIKAQGLINKFYGVDIDPARHTASEAHVLYTDTAYGLDASYRERATKMNMLFVDEGEDTNITDQIGDPGLQRIQLDGWYKINSMIKAGLVSSLTVATEKPSDNAQDLNFKPYADVTVNEKTTVSAYGKVSYALKAGYGYAAADQKHLYFPEAGAKVTLTGLSSVLSSLDLVYGFDNNDTDKVLNSLIATGKLPHDVTVDVGLGARTVKDFASKAVKDANNMIGASLGAAWKVPAAYNPILYGQFVYNMDPYQDFGDGQNGLKFDGYVLDDGQAKGDKVATVRIGMKWDF